MKRLVLSLAGLALAMAACAQHLEPKIVNGDPADWEHFQATCSFKSPGKSKCTCVLVGPRALLTAAHCMKKPGEGKKVKGEIRIFKQGMRSVDCSPADGIDLAVCRVSGDEGIKDIPFENLSDHQLKPKETKLLLTGFGCTKKSEASKQGKLHKGEAVVDDLPGNRIKLGTGKSSLCPGDSGGPGYLLLDGDPLGSRLVAGINDEDFHLTSVSAPAANNFICGWATANAPICGCPTKPESGCREVE